MFQIPDNLSNTRVTTESIVGTTVYKNRNIFNAFHECRLFTYVFPSIVPTASCMNFKVSYGN